MKNHPSYPSWGHYPKLEPAQVIPLHWRSEDLKWAELSYPVLPYGQGRSYGDSCLNEGGILLATEGLNRFIHFDEKEGILSAEAGVTLAEILDLIVPRGWFLPVSPGTKFVSLGGAIANDIHGKNHHRDGTFGNHVKRFELERSDRGRLLCTPTENKDLFCATIGGLGLTGLITWAEIRLKSIQTAYLETESIRFENLDEFFEISEKSDQGYEYTVAWIDTLARDKALGRGIFMRGNHEMSPKKGGLLPASRHAMDIPLEAPNFLLNSFSIRLFNNFYYRRHREKVTHKTEHFDSFFYPLDGVGHWNRLYGPRGFVQYQCVVPDVILRTMLDLISRSGCASFLTVLKKFGNIPSPGLLSFPRPGATLALDFAFEGRKTLDLLNQLDRIVRECGGAVYPAKDARMSPENFRAFYPQWREFQKQIDPKFSSSFWRRVMGEGKI